MKHNTDTPRHDSNLRNALKAIPEPEIRLSSNFTWRTMQSVYTEADNQRRRQQRYIRIAGIAACTISAIGAVGLGIWLATPSLNHAMKECVANLHSAQESQSPVLLATAISLTILIGAERLLHYAYFRRKH